MKESSPISPEARRVSSRGRRRLPWQDEQGRAHILTHVWIVAKRVAVGVYNDGFIHAGNLAYLSLLALFPFFIVAASIASVFGQTQDGTEAVNAFFMAVPRNVADALRQPIHDVIHARTGSGIVWLGVAVGVWTSGSLIETIRDILRRAYGTHSGAPFWQHRLRAIAIVILSVIGTMVAFSAQVAIAGIDQFIQRVFPFADEAIYLVQATRLVPLVVLCLTLYGLFYTLTPKKYRLSSCPKWPGAVLTALWWYGTVMVLPWVLSHLSTYDMTYGSLAGVMITLIFFFVVGLGVVIGAELNAALADLPPQDDQDRQGKQEVDHA